MQVFNLHVQTDRLHHDSSTAAHHAE